MTEERALERLSMAEQHIMLGTQPDHHFDQWLPELSEQDATLLFGVAMRVGNLKAAIRLFEAFPWVTGTTPGPGPWTGPDGELPLIQWTRCYARFLHVLRTAAWRRHIEVVRWLLWLPWPSPRPSPGPGLPQFADSDRAEICLVINCLVDQDLEERFAEFLSPQECGCALYEASQHRLEWFTRALVKRGHVLWPPRTVPMLDDGAVAGPGYFSLVISRVIPFLILTCQTLEPIRACYPDDNEILIVSVCASNLGALALALKHGCNPNQGPDTRRAIWCCAVDHRPWHRHTMVKMLLDAGASPFVSDARGVLLIDCMTAGNWWLTTKKVERMEATDGQEHAAIVKALRESMSTWTTARHAMFPAAFRARVRCMLLCNQRTKNTSPVHPPRPAPPRPQKGGPEGMGVGKGQGVPWLPRDVMYLLISYLARAEATQREPKVLDSFLLRELKFQARLSNPVGPPLAASRKRDYQELLLGAVDTVEAAYQRAYGNGPAMIGKLSVFNRERELMLEHDIPNPLTPGMREISVGRAVRDTRCRGEATANVLLENAPRSVSRIHFILRANEQKRWQIRVTGNIAITQGPGSMVIVSDRKFSNINPDLEFHVGDHFTFKLTSFI